MKNCTVINGLNSKTPENLLLGPGAVYKDFTVGTDTVLTASAKLLGATKGGSGFKAVPSIRQVEIDGLRGAVKGMDIVDGWEITLSAKIVEVTAANLKLAVGPATQTAGTAGPPNTADWEIIKGTNCVLDTDYASNITWIGSLSGTDKPVIIQVYNALNTKGLELSFEDKGEGVIEAEFRGSYDLNKLGEVPFAIFYPKITV